MRFGDTDGFVDVERLRRRLLDELDDVRVDEPLDDGGELADLLDDAMEDEISASVARGYCVDAETGALVVGAAPRPRSRFTG